MTKVKFPKKIKILGTDWKIVVAPQAASEDSQELFGETDDNTFTIYIYTEPHKRYPKKGSLKDTLLHECLHAILATTGLKNILGSNGLAEETLVSGIEAGLCPLIKKGLFK